MPGTWSRPVRRSPFTTCERDPRFDREAAEATGYLPQSILAVPIETASEVSGVIEVLDWTEDRIGEVGLELAAVFSNTQRNQ